MNSQILKGRFQTHFDGFDKINVLILNDYRHFSVMYIASKK